MQHQQPTTSTATRLCLTLPLAPSINEQYYTDKQGRRRLTPKALRYKSDVQKVLRGLEQQGILNESLLKRMSACYLALSIECYFATPLQRDLDGGLKITLDALCEGLGLNDNRVVDIHLSKRIDPLHPHLFVELEAIADWQFDKEYILLS